MQSSDGLADVIVNAFKHSNYRSLKLLNHIMKEA